MSRNHTPERVQELLEANNALLERARRAEQQVKYWREHSRIQTLGHAEYAKEMAALGPPPG